MRNLGDTTVDVVGTPGHSPGTLSFLFPVKDGDRTLTVAYSRGTAFNFPRRPESFAIYRDSAARMHQAASAAGATVLMTNHTRVRRRLDGSASAARRLLTLDKRVSRREGLLFVLLFGLFVPRSRLV